MPAACAFVILTLCLPPEMTPPQAHDYLLSADAISSGPGFRLWVATRSDFHQMYEDTATPEACAGTACVHYVRICRTALKCDYQVWAPGQVMRALGFELTAGTPQAWRWAEQNLALVATGPSGEARLPLSALRKKTRPVGG